MEGLTTLVLAAGRGTRQAAISGGRPKPLTEIAGIPILVRTLNWLAESGVSNLWINLHWRPQDIIAAVEHLDHPGMTVRFSHETSLLGTAGAARNLAAEWQETGLLVVYGDNLTRFDLREFVRFHRTHGGAATVALFDPDVHPHTGIAGGRVSLGADGVRIESFREGAPAGTPGYVNCGVYALSSKVIDFIPTTYPSDFSHDVFPALLAGGAGVNGFVIDGYCLGVDTPEAHARAMSLVEGGRVVLS